MKSSIKKPYRLQRKRTKGWQMPIYAKYVGRPTIWGNPFKIHKRCNREQAVNKYEKFVYGLIRQKPEYEDIIKREFKGWILCCWCPLDKPCHADILLEIANSKN